MDHTLKNRAQKLFIEAIELPLLERQKFLIERCENNTQLFTMTTDLINAYEKSNHYFDELEKSISNSQLNEIEDHLFRDSDFGNYQIIHVMKQGGMGTIFLARRSDGEFERDVVIKMIPIDLNTLYAQNQFAHEKEILASLMHPNIVQLYDSGTTDKGQSYFVMELVKGQSIINYCNNKTLNFKERINLFCEVLHAIGYAHQHLVIHGDIKPSNIMVNDEGQIKLLDFGIARLLHNNDVKLNGYSLSYLTPEHKQKQSIITTTDIHQLGQLLFELLTGVSPKHARNERFEFPLLKDSLSDIHLDELTQNTNLRINKIKQIYNSDIQYIIAKALQPLPSKRYGSVQEMEDDIQRYLKGYCIKARETTLAYRFFTSVKRNKVLSFSLVSLLVLSVIFSIVVAQKNTVLKLERDKALKLKNLITDVFSAADPSTAPGKELTAVEVLDLGLKRVGESFQGETETEAELLTDIANTYQSLGKYQKAQPILERVYFINKKLHSDNELVLAKVKFLLGKNLRLMSKNSEAKDFLEQSISALKSQPKKNELLLAAAKNELGRVLVLLGDFSLAEKTLDESTHLFKNIYGENSLEYAQALNGLNAAYFRQGKYKQVQKLLLKTKHIREEIYADKIKPLLDKDYATNINNLGLAFYLDGNLTEAETYFKQAIELRNKIYLKPHPEQAQSLTNLGLLLNDSGRVAEAQNYLTQALKIRELTLNKGHMRIIEAKNNLAMVLHGSAQFEKAEEIYQAILQEIIQQRGEKHPITLSIMTNRANTLLQLHNYKLAQQLFQKSLDYRQISLPKDHLYLSYNYIGLSQAQLAQGNAETAKEFIDKALSIRLEKLPENHWLIGESYYVKALVEQALGLNSRSLLTNACEILSNSIGNEYFLTKKCKLKSTH